VYDVRSRIGAVTNVKLTIPLADLTEGIVVGGGHALIVDGATRMTGANYVGLDTAGAPPTLAPVASVFPADATAEGVLWRVDANAIDDVQVRQVELFLGAVRLARDTSPPFELSFRAPAPGGQDPEVVQVIATDMAGNF